MNSMLIFILLLQVTYITSQSTCPVVMNSLNELGHHQQRCKCGIKTDGQIYIYCARKQLKRLQVQHLGGQSLVFEMVLA